MFVRPLERRQRALSARDVLWPCLLAAATLGGCVAETETARVTRSEDTKFCGVEMPACDWSETDGAVADAQVANSANAPPVPTFVSVASSPGADDSPLTGDSPLTSGSSSGGGAPESGGSSSDDSLPASGGGWPGGEDSSGSATLAGQLGVDPRELEALLARLAADIAPRSRSDTGPAPSSTTATVVMARQAVKGERLAKAKTGLIVASDEGTNAGGGSGNGRAAMVIPDGSDDDIIARRLRRAAELERDPTMKQKLWQEYLSYRQNARAP